MPLTSEITTGTFDNFYSEFETNFPDERSRWEAARQIVECPDAPLPSPEYLSHNLLLAQWGSKEEELRARADFLFRLKFIIDTYRTPILVFTKGTPEDVLDPDDDRLNDDVVIECGRTSTDAYDIRFGGSTDSKAKGYLGVEPPYLAFAVGTPIRRPARISVDMLDPKCQVGSYKAQERLLDVLEGAVPLPDKPNTGYYHRMRKVNERSVVIGRTATREVLNALSEKSIGPARQKFTSLFY